MLALAKLFMLGLSLLFQTIDPSGYWAGAISMPEMLLHVEIDIDKRPDGRLAATFAQPEQGLKGYPFSSVTVDGRTVRLELRLGPGNSTFEGVVSADGQELSGTATQAGMSAPFTLTRKGAARTTPTPKSPAITTDLAGAWNGAVEASGQRQRIVLRLWNNPDGTSNGTVMSPDGSGVEIPVAIAQSASDVSISVPSVGVTFTATLDAATRTLAGHWTQSGFKLPLTLTRAEQ